MNTLTTLSDQGGGSALVRLILQGRCTRLRFRGFTNKPKQWLEPDQKQRNKVILAYDLLIDSQLVRVANVISSQNKFFSAQFDINRTIPLVLFIHSSCQH